MSVNSIPVDKFLTTIVYPNRYHHLVTKLDTYKCFVTNGGERERGIENTNARYRYNGRKARLSQPRMRQERPRIGMRELSREDMCKKEFLSLTNKVSPQNKDAIVKKLLTGLAPQFSTMYCGVIWTIMQRPVQIYQNIYAELARIVAINTPSPDKQIFKRAWEECWQNVTVGENAFVLIPEAFMDVTDEAIFHEWSIWKKSRINLARGCVYLCLYGIFTQPSTEIFDPVMAAVENAVLSSETSAATHVLDYWLDVLGMSWEAQSEMQQVIPRTTIQKLNTWAQQSATLQPKCRFKVESLKNKYCKDKNK